MLDRWCRSAYTCAKFGVTAFKASMLDMGGRSAKFGIVRIQGMYAELVKGRSDSTSGRFDVAVLKASVLNWWGIDLPVHLPSVV